MAQLGGALAAALRSAAPLLAQQCGGAGSSLAPAAAAAWPAAAAAAAGRGATPASGRGWASAAAAAPAPPRLLEVREYTLHPAGVKPYLQLCAQHADLRKRLLPFLGMFTCDTGGELNKVTHFYSYSDMGQREAARAAAAADAQWAAFVDAGREHIQKQESRIMLEASALYAATSAPGAAGFAPPVGGGRGMYEFRQYQLHPGYGSVPKLLKAFEEGLPDKIAADPEGRLVAFAHSDVGMLNNVIELWRYPSAAACIKARQAARGVPKWRETIGAVTPGVQFFTTGFMVPTSFSPWQ